MQNLGWLTARFLQDPTKGGAKLSKIVDVEKIGIGAIYTPVPNSDYAVYAARDGIVKIARCGDDYYGGQIVIQHAKNYYTRYGFVGYYNDLVQVGKPVKMGQKIAVMIDPKLPMQCRGAQQEVSLRFEVMSDPQLPETTIDPEHLIVSETGMQMQATMELFVMGCLVVLPFLLIYRYKPEWFGIAKNYATSAFKKKSTTTTTTAAQ